MSALIAERVVFDAGRRGRDEGAELARMVMERLGRMTFRPAAEPLRICVSVDDDEHSERLAGRIAAAIAHEIQRME